MMIFYRKFHCCVRCLEMLHNVNSICTFEDVNTYTPYQMKVCPPVCFLIATNILISNKYVAAIISQSVPPYTFAFHVC